MFNYVSIKHKQMSFLSNGGKFKLYTVLNGLIFPTPTQPRISFECAMVNVTISLSYAKVDEHKMVPPCVPGKTEFLNLLYRVSQN
jgi:hypothetical protein